MRAVHSRSGHVFTVSAYQSHLRVSMTAPDVLSVAESTAVLSKRVHRIILTPIDDLLIVSTVLLLCPAACRVSALNPPAVSITLLPHSGAGRYPRNLLISTWCMYPRGSCQQVQLD